MNGLTSAEIYGPLFNLSISGNIYDDFQIYYSERALSVVLRIATFALIALQLFVAN
jgi:hypothetical protein